MDGEIGESMEEEEEKLKKMYGKERSTASPRLFPHWENALPRLLPNDSRAYHAFGSRLLCPPHWL